MCDVEVSAEESPFFSPLILAYNILQDKEGGLVPLPIEDLEQQRAVILRNLTDLGDFRPGSITTISGRCGKPNCRCHRSGEPPHGPTDRLTFKVENKTVTESLSSPAALAKAKREVEEFRNYRRLSQQFVDVNTRICGLRPVQEVAPQSRQEKKQPRRSNRNLPVR